uniref:Protein kinase AMP-activated non-catalytic subunit beta 2 n=1 Tax=Ornithorhynchus anatinus TaxID=9258 RepID=A0A6I8P3U5_ORNAN
MGNTASERLSGERHGSKWHRGEGAAAAHGPAKDQPHKIMVGSADDPSLFSLSDSKPMVTSQLGTINNWIQVKKSDFEVFDALKLDSLESSETSCRDLSGSPPGLYGQEMYVFRSEERSRAPPILPPHLLQIILNKDTNISCDPALLPEPNHVMLNHLYALSIKDSVMVLSATHRYKKKYVTTLLYKPI